ncbi:MAG: hypothetical protein QXL02_02615 [Candidatus Anstonellales archaeon]
MRIVETLLIFTIILNVLYIIYYYYIGYTEFEIRRQEHLKIKLLLLEASQRYIEQNSYTISGSDSMEYLGRTILIDTHPSGRDCIYRYMNLSGKISKIFFCSE